MAVLQAALLGVVGLILALGLALAVGRYEARRAAVVEEANAIGTTYLRARPWPSHPKRFAPAAGALHRHQHPSLAVGARRPARPPLMASSCSARCGWGLAGQALETAPTASAPRLYVDSLSQMIDLQTVRVAGLNNRVPGPVLVLKVASAALALGLLAFDLAILGRGVLTVLLAAALVTLLLWVTFDLDRPTHGLIRIPATPLTDLRASTILPAVTGPTNP